MVIHQNHDYSHYRAASALTWACEISVWLVE
jgi:hypothetical protein